MTLESGAFYSVYGMVGKLMWADVVTGYAMCIWYECSNERRDDKADDRVARRTQRWHTSIEVRYEREDLRTTNVGTEFDVDQPKEEGGGGQRRTDDEYCAVVLPTKKLEERTIVMWIAKWRWSWRAGVSWWLIWSYLTDDQAFAILESRWWCFFNR